MAEAEAKEKAMRIDENNDKVYESTGEAIQAQKEFSLEMIRGLFEMRDVGHVFSIPKWRCLLLDWANMNRRFLIAQNRKILFLLQKLEEAGISINGGKLDGRSN